VRVEFPAPETDVDADENEEAVTNEKAD